MLKGENINGYNILEDFKVAGGMSKISFAESSISAIMTRILPIKLTSAEFFPLDAAERNCSRISSVIFTSDLI